MNIEIADNFLNQLKISQSIQDRAVKKAREGYVMALLEAGEISSGRAGKIMDISRLKVVEMMERWNISVFDDSQDIEELRLEVEQTESALFPKDS